MLTKFGLGFIAVGLFGAIVGTNVVLPLLVGSSMLVLSAIRG